MPTFLDFNTTSTFRDFLISRTLQQPNGPQTFTAQSYVVQNLSNFANVDPGDVVTGSGVPIQGSRAQGITQTQTLNVFKPLQYFIKETIDTLPRRANLSLYPYFQFPTDHNIIGIMSNGNYDTESELFKFAANNIRTNPQGPVYARIAQNLGTAIDGRARLIDALNGNTTTALNILTGREPLVDLNNKITVASTLPGKGIDFLQTVAGIEFPFSEIPGDYLSNPANPVNYRPTPSSEFGKVLQDMTGVLGSLIGIQRRSKLDRKPSDLFIEYMGEGQRQRLFDNLSYSKYGPNYTTSARSQQSSKIFNFVDNVAQGVKNLLGLEAPAGQAYIGDDRGNDVKFAMGDFNDRPVRSSYFLSLMFDEVQAKLFTRTKNITEGGPIGGKLTWISQKSKNKLGANNKEYQDEASALEESLSTQYGFRDGSILRTTQDILDTMPKDGGAARSHVANVIDQTSRIFREGDVMLSRGSAIKYVDKFGEETGVEYCRAWTKDRSYMNFSDTMRTTELLRKFDGSVMGGKSRPWNINYAPMSNGNKSFEGSTNIFERTEGAKDFYAKKYMFSIENLAWKSSTMPGFMVQDLPYCERGNNGGRVMWFPPYDLKVSESNSARWESNTFLGRPEPIYTYQNTERSGQIGFKIVVDHPSILNLLVREHFKGMSDEEADNYINAFFAGCKELDFYDLIRRYTTLEKDDITIIKSYLNKGGDPEVIRKYKTVTEPPTVIDPSTNPQSNGDNNVKTENESLDKVRLHYENDYPEGSSLTIAGKEYTEEFNRLITQKSKYITDLTNDVNIIVPSSTTNDRKDKKQLFGTETPTESAPQLVTDSTTKISGYFDGLATSFSSYTGKTDTLKKDLSGTGTTVQSIEITINSSTSSVASDTYNERLSLRRSSSVLKDFFKRISKDGVTMPPIDPKWIKAANIKDNYSNNGITVSKTNGIVINAEFDLKDFGWDQNKGKLKVTSTNYGEKFTSTTRDQDCLNRDFNRVSLRIHSPIAFYCRHSEVSFKYTKSSVIPPTIIPPVPTELPRTRIVTEDEIVPTKIKKPSIDIMKRIIMKTLSECYYFKVLEEDSPLAFKSLREKLRYFHPGFHSTTPEGLNSRLNFLQQCLRPGDTIPIKGLADKTDLNARNTSFGPPPICVIRIGDFYHSKIVIKDINISYDDSTWDLNPEGIGVQPMIANVTMQVSFIGGQGLETPVEKLQNALSSNFYANTEIYDERSIATNTKIGGRNAEEFTKEFLEQLQKDQPQPKDTQPEDSKSKISPEGTYIGGAGGDFTSLINNVFDTTKTYFENYETSYNTIITKYGNKLGSIFFSPDYRTINSYDVYNNIATSSPIQLFGLYPKTFDLPIIVRGVKLSMVSRSQTEDLCQTFGFDKVLTGPKIDKANELLKPYIKTFIEKKLDEISETNPLDDFEMKRNNLITALDKVNVLVKYGFYDYSIKGEVVSEATLSGYTYDKLYKEYKSCVDYITNNTSKLFSGLDTSQDFSTSSITVDSFKEILGIFYKEDVDKNNLMKDVFETDTIIFTERIRNKLKNKLDDFSIKPEKEKFKFSKFHNRTNSKEVKFSIQSVSGTTDSGKVEDIKSLFSTPFNVTSKLNFYKK